MKTYNIFLATKDGNNDLEKTINSILNQTVLPNHIFIYNDNSDFPTIHILSHYQEYYSNIHVIHNNQKHEYTTAILPYNLNQLFNLAELMNIRNTDYEVILADDIELSPNYSETLLNYLKENPDVAIISGNEMTKYDYHSPRGAGRFILSSFFKNCCLKGYFTPDLTFESIIIFECMRMGYRKEILNHVKFNHLRPSGSKHGFRSYGKAMKQLRYTKSYVFFRLARNLITGQEFKKRYTLRVLYEYLKEKPSETIYPKELNDFIKQYQHKRILGYVFR